MRPAARLLDQLSTARYRLNRAAPSVGVGDRRSRAKGAGMEFVEHRPYREGDDVRNLDPRLMARLGKSFVREYAIDRQLPVYIILDASTSMASGGPETLDFAGTLAQVFGFIALASGEQAQMGFFGVGGMTWSPRLQGANRADILFDWYSRQNAGGTNAFSEALRQARGTMTKSALVILISDFWDDRIESAIGPLVVDGHDLVAIHVCAPRDADPALLGGGPVYVVDAETGERLEMVLDGTTLASYRSAFAAWQAELKQVFSRRQGRYFPLLTNANLEQFFLRELRIAGLIS